MAIFYSAHASSRIHERGTNKREVESTIKRGKRLPDEYGRIKFEHVFILNKIYKGTYYKSKKVIVSAEKDINNNWTVITVLTKFFN